MQNSLQTIQKIAKIAKIIATIVFVCSIIGAICLTIALISTVSLRNIDIEGISIVGLIEEATETSFASYVFSSVVALASCIGSIITSKFAMIYLTHELEDGTPFTPMGSKELLRYGILATAIPFGISTLSGLAFTVTKILVPHLDDSLLSNETVSLGFGIMVIILSIVCKHGSELAEKIYNKE